MTHQKIIKWEKVDGTLKQITIVSKQKADIRNSIQEHNDELDLIADISNALNDLLAGLDNSPAIQKFKDRQGIYKGIIDEIIN